MVKAKRELPVAAELRQVLVKIIIEGMMVKDDGTLWETFKPPCQVCVETKRLASEALGVTPFWEDEAKELNSLILNLNI